MGEAILYEELTLDKALGLAETRGIIIWPVATTEAHGDHLPLATDTFTAEWIAKELSRITGLPALVPTPIRAGASPTFHYDTHGDPIRGTLAISHSTMHALIKDITRGLWSAGFRKVVIIQGHGQEPNFQVLAHEVSTELRREGKPMFIAAATYWELAAQTLRETLNTPFFHAGEEETSNMMFVRPDLVRMEAMKGKEPEPLLDRALLKRATTHDETETFAIWDVASSMPIPEKGELKSAGVGRPEDIKTASPEKGKKVLTSAMETYLALIRDLEMYYGPQEVPGVDVRKRPGSPRFKVDY